MLREHGAAPFRVVVVHGGPNAAGEMGPVARRLAERRGVLEPMQTATTVDGEVEELRAALESRAELPMVLIGHSWGAWLCCMVAARYPRLVGKLILIGSGLIECPVVAIHGAYDPHPADGVREPLARTLRDFRMVVLDRCGHDPWRERQAVDTFYAVLARELSP